MKNLAVLILLISTFAVVAQENKSDVKPQWIIGFGANIIDNTATKNGNYFNASEQWNYLPTISKVSLEIPFEKFDERNGLTLPINSIGFANNTLYVGTDNGILYSEDMGKTYKKIGFAKNQIWMIKPYKKSNPMMA